MDNFSCFPQINYLTIVPVSEGTLEQQIQDCYQKLSNLLVRKKNKKESIIKQTVFIKSGNNTQYYTTKAEILQLSGNYYGFFVPTTIVSQKPENNVLLSMEITLLTNPENYKVHRKNFEGTAYTCIKNNSFSLLVSGGLALNSKKTDIFRQSHQAFSIMNELLKLEGFSLSDVVRQWNYIENITEFTVQNGSKSQHYQIFNDVRSEYYGQVHFKNGYPAATGIGTNSGGVVVDFIAYKAVEEDNVYALKNPVQTDAHKYTHKVLEENNMVPKKTESTPKFERAKLIVHHNGATMFISGTAAIKGEQTIAQGDIDMQTRVTLENIAILAGHENLTAHGIHASFNKKYFSLLRVYVKNETNIQAVKNIIDELHPYCPCKIIQSDICRSNLLIEIEGVMEFE
ncbi:MAG: hypothetical protein JXB34_05855 [Bacteroidales bacterium]|nr:hypothetical protein [Bacteroidales bacterium]